MGARGLRRRPKWRAILGVLLVVSLLAVGVLWRGDAVVPTRLAGYLEGARQTSRTDASLALSLVPLRFVEARCRGDDAVFVFEPTLPFFGGLSAYAVGHFAPPDCVGDCVGAVVGIGPADFQRDWSGVTPGSCG
jgi:hypothetical protein